jgi:sigma-E factor negative regulatory protein RseC
MEARDKDGLQGTVLAIERGKATIRLERQQDGACGGCARSGACSIARLAFRCDDRALLRLEAPPDLRVGDQVCLAEPQTGLPLLALLGYVFPAFALVSGAALGQHLYGDDGPAALCALCAFFLALFLTRLATARLPGLCAPTLISHHTELPHEH